jgi:hypothetical protein
VTWTLFGVELPVSIIFGLAVIGGFCAGVCAINAYGKIKNREQVCENSSFRWMIEYRKWLAADDECEWEDWLADDVGDKGFSLPLRTLENIPPEELEKMAWEHLRTVPRKKWMRIIFSSGFEVKL